MNESMGEECGRVGWHVVCREGVDVTKAIENQNICNISFE